MFCKLFLVVVFLHTTAIYANQLKEIQLICPIHNNVFSAQKIFRVCEIRFSEQMTFTQKNGANLCKG